MHAPAFWAEGGLAARALTPFGTITEVATARRVARPGWQAPVPVFCCGNATVGGAGKTTLALDLGARLLAEGKRVHFLSRGYGGTARGVTRVDPSGHNVAQVGDEPLLLARLAPCWVGANRADLARAAVADGAQILVMDDGLQNSDLSGRRNILVVDGLSGFGNGRLFPAGPLRERPEAAALRCEVAVLIGEDRRGVLAQLPASLPVLRARLVPDAAEVVAGRRVFAFAGVAQPEKFRAGLYQIGALVAGTAWFADHHPYTEREVMRLLREAESAYAVPVTTPKDHVRLPAWARARITVVGVSLAWAEPEALARWLHA
jgi:tetraacyldisaccharide 4'-kinase